MALAVRALSPVSMTTRMPIFFSCRMASPESALMVSATATIPRSLPSFANSRGVLPCSARVCARSDISWETGTRADTYFRLPPSSSSPASLPRRPLPGRASKSSRLAGVMSFFSPSARMALARGCSLLASRARDRARSFSSLMPCSGTRSVTLGAPSVMVPVLSRTTILVLPVCSRLTAVLKRMPFLAPTPLPTIMATGVANPKAQGQLMTSTEMPRARA